MLCTVQRFNAGKSPDYLFTSQYAFRRQREEEREPVHEVEEEIDTSSLDILLRSKPALTRR